MIKKELYLEVYNKIINDIKDFKCNYFSDLLMVYYLIKYSSKFVSSKILGIAHFPNNQSVWGEKINEDKINNMIYSITKVLSILIKNEYNSSDDMKNIIKILTKEYTYNIIKKIKGHHNLIEEVHKIKEKIELNKNILIKDKDALNSWWNKLLEYINNY